MGDYSNPNAKGKAESYEKGLGYTKDNAAGLIKQIHDYVTGGNKPYEVSQSEYGTKYKYRIQVQEFAQYYFKQKQTVSQD